MIYGLLSDGDTFKSGDEMMSPNCYEWEPVPSQWHGGKVSYSQYNTFSRFKIPVRRALEKVESSPTAHNNARDEICPYCRGRLGLYCPDCNKFFPCLYCKGTGKLPPVA
jgi:hypothetical protein